MSRRSRVEAFCLSLYPREFRRRFGPEWSEVVAWRRDAVRGRIGARLRFGWFLFADTLRALPRAHLAALLGSRRGAGSTRRRPGEELIGHRRRGHGPDDFAHDVRQALRGLRRNPWFALAAVASVALGVGANTAIFSVVNGVLLDPLPYRDADRLVIVWNEFTVSGLARLPLSPIGVEELRDEPGIFDGVAGIWSTTRTIAVGDRPVQVSAGLTTPDFFEVLGVEPSLGRTWAEGDRDRTPDGVVLSHEIWRDHFGSDPSVVGREIRVDGEAVPVLGVLPAGFKLHFPEDGSIPETLDVYVPLPWDLRPLPTGQHYLRVVGRLSRGVDIEEARAGVLRASDRMRATYPVYAATGDRFSATPLQADAVRAAQPVLLVILVGTGLFLLLASANVGNLFIARTATRRSELAVRAALGASRARLAGLVALESGLVAIAGGAAGLWLGVVGGNVLWALRPAGIARVDALALDGTVFGYAAFSCAVAAMMFGLAPVLGVIRLPAATTLRVAGALPTTGSRLRETLTVAEIALGLVLLAGAALVGQTLMRLNRVDPGFQAEDVLTFRLALPFDFLPTDADRARVASEVERRIRQLPGVRAVGATSHLPLARWANWGGGAPPDGTPEAEAESYFADHRSVTPGYLDAAGMRLARGRWFDARDAAGSEPVVVIDRAFAERAFPGTDAIGRVIHPSRYIDGAFVPTPATVVGIVDNVRDVSLARPSAGQVFWPFNQSARWELTFLVHAQAGAAPSVATLESQIHAVHGDLVPARVAPFDDFMRAATAQTRYIAMLGGIFSALAVLLAALGLYGVVTFLGVRRLREFSLRLVLGAHPRTILRSVLRDGLRLGAFGVLAGIVLVLTLSRFIGNLLFEVSPSDPATIAAVALALLAIAVGASALPALRAARTDPMSALRSN